MKSCTKCIHKNQCLYQKEVQGAFISFGDKAIIRHKMHEDICRAIGKNCKLYKKET